MLNVVHLDVLTCRAHNDFLTRCTKSENEFLVTCLTIYMLTETCPIPVTAQVSANIAQEMIQSHSSSIYDRVQIQSFKV